MEIGMKHLLGGKKSRGHRTENFGEVPDVG